MKNIFCTISGALGSVVAYLFGGWSSAMTTLILFMCIDYVSGLILAGVFKASTKTENGRLESKTGWKGLCRKGMTLLFVLIGYRLDLALNFDYIKNVVIIAFITNELISIVENAGLMGVPIPKIILNAIEILKEKGDNDENNKINND